MAGMKFTADIDVEGIIKLRQEINKLKNSLKAVAGIRCCKILGIGRSIRKNLKTKTIQ